jgi:hypothetical protein
MASSSAVDHGHLKLGSAATQIGCDTSHDTNAKSLLPTQTARLLRWAQALLPTNRTPGKLQRGRERCGANTPRRYGNSAVRTEKYRNLPNFSLAKFIQNKVKPSSIHL